MLQTGEVVFTPPQDYETIQELLDNLESYINEENEIDPLINMAIIHYQFESIHPFYDGNGRTGRIINILYLSRYIIKNKVDYYRLLQEVRTKENWEEWVLYMLDGVEKTSLSTIELIENINLLMQETQAIVKEQLPKLYSKDLIEILFMHPYTKMEFLVNRLGISR